MITEIKNKIAMTSQNCLPPHDDLKIIFSQKKYFFCSIFRAYITFRLTLRNDKLFPAKVISKTKGNEHNEGPQ